MSRDVFRQEGLLVLLISTHHNTMQDQLFDLEPFFQWIHMSQCRFNLVKHHAVVSCMYPVTASSAILHSRRGLRMLRGKGLWVLLCKAFRKLITSLMNKDSNGDLFAHE